MSMFPIVKSDDRTPTAMVRPMLHAYVLVLLFKIITSTVFYAVNNTKIPVRHILKLSKKTLDFFAMRIYNVWRYSDCEGGFCFGPW